MEMGIIIGLAIISPVWIACYLYGPSIRNSFFSDPDSESKGARILLAAFAFFVIFLYSIFAPQFAYWALYDGFLRVDGINPMPSFIAATIIYYRTSSSSSKESPKAKPREIQKDSEVPSTHFVFKGEVIRKPSDDSSSPEQVENKKRDQSQSAAKNIEPEKNKRADGLVLLGVVGAILFVISIAVAVSTDGSSSTEETVSVAALPVGQHRSFCITNNTLREMSFSVEYTSRDIQGYRLRPNYKIELTSTYSQAPLLHSLLENYVLDAPVSTVTSKCGGRYEFDYRNLPQPGYAHGVYDPVGFYESSW